MSGTGSGLTLESEGGLKGRRRRGIIQKFPKARSVTVSAALFTQNLRSSRTYIWIEMGCVVLVSYNRRRQPCCSNYVQMIPQFFLSEKRKVCFPNLLRVVWQPTPL